MKTLHLIAAGSLTLFMAFPVQAHEELATYKTQAESLLKEIKAKSNKVENDSKALVDASMPIVDSFIKKFPQCSEYLTALKNAADVIPTLPLEEIESGYHADGKLPKFDDANCYHAKDLLVHPATVQAMAKLGIKTDEQWESAEHEIAEVLGHFSAVEAAME